MKWIDDDLRADLRARTHHCQHCGKRARNPEVHHIEPKGMDGSKHLDVRINLIVLGGPWDCTCHRLWHDTGNKRLREKFREIVADRENVTVAYIEDRMAVLVRIPTWWGWTPEDILQGPTPEGLHGITPEGPKI